MAGGAGTDRTTHRAGRLRGVAIVGVSCLPELLARTRSAGLQATSDAKIPTSARSRSTEADHDSFGSKVVTSLT